MAKTAHDFQMSFVAFQRAQQASAEKQRTVVEGVKLAVHEDESQYVSPCFFYLIIRPSPGGPQPSRNVSFEAQHLMLRAERRYIIAPRWNITFISSMTFVVSSGNV